MHLLGIFSVLEVDEGEAPGAAGLLVVDDADITDGAVFGEHLPQVPLRGVQTEPKHTQAAVGIWICLQSGKGKQTLSCATCICIDLCRQKIQIMRS